MAGRPGAVRPALFHEKLLMTGNLLHRVPRRGFLRSAAGAFAATFWADETLDAALQYSAPPPNRPS